MFRQIDPAQTAIWQQALTEAQAQASSSEDWTRIEAELKAGDLSPQNYELLRPYYEAISASGSGVPLAALWGTELYAWGDKLRGGGPAPVALERFAEIRTKGIRTNSDIALALEYIQLVAPEFGGELVRAYQGQNGSITIVVDPDLKRAEGLTEILPINYFDRSARYPIRIRLAAGTNLLTIVHELIHALPEDMHPSALRGRNFPVLEQSDKVQNLRNGAKRALFFEESNAFGSEMIFLAEAKAYDPKFPLSNHEKALFKFFEGSGNTVVERLSALQANLPKLMPNYEQQAKISSILVAMAGKTGNERNPKYGPAQFIDSILGESSTGDAHGGRIDPEKAVKALYQLMNAGGKNQDLGMNTFDALLALLDRVQKGDVDGALEDLVSRLELRFDGTEFIGKAKGILASLAGAQSLGDRGTPRDLSHDRGYFSEPDMAQVIVKGWGALARYIDQQRASGELKGSDYLRFLYNVAEQSENPYAGELYGQASMLAYAQAEQKPQMLLNLAESLGKSGYHTQAAQALLAYLDLTQKNQKGMFSSEYGGYYAETAVAMSVESVRNYIEAASHLPPAQRADVVRELFSRWIFLDSTVLTMEKVFASQFEKGFSLNDAEKAELKGIFAQGHTTIDAKKLDEFIKRVLKRNKGLAKAEKGDFSLPDWDDVTKDKVRVIRAELLDAFAKDVSYTLPILQILNAKSAPAEGVTASAMTDGQAEVWQARLQELPQLQKKIFEEKWGGGYISADVESAILQRFSRSQPNAYLHNLCESFFKSYHNAFLEAAEKGGLGIPYFEIMAQLIEQVPESYEKFTMLARWQEGSLEHFSPEQKLWYYRQMKFLVERMAEKELSDPGYLSRFKQLGDKLEDWTAKKEAQSKRVKQVSVANPELLPTQKNQLEFYFNWMRYIARSTLQESSPDLQAFGRDCLAEASIQSGSVVSWAEGFDLEWNKALSIHPQAGPVINSEVNSIRNIIYTLSEHDFTGLYANSPQEARSLLQQTLVFYERYVSEAPGIEVFRDRDNEYFYRSKLLQIATISAQVGEVDFAKRFVDLATQCEAREGQFPVKQQNFLHLYQHAQQFLAWHELMQAGNVTEAQLRADAFLEQMRADLAGRVNYRADELLSLAKMTSTIPGMEEKAEQIFEQAIDRYVHRFGEERDWKESKINSQSIAADIHKDKNLSDGQKDRLLSRLIDGMAGLVGVEDKYAKLFFDTAMGIAEYLKDNRYPQADRRLYHHGSQLAQMLPVFSSRLNPHDVIAGVSFLATYFLRENPWLRDPNAHVNLSSNADWRYLRELGAVFPGQVVAYAPHLLPNGKLNTIPAAEGFVDLPVFVGELMVQLEAGSLTEAEAANAATAATLGALSQAETRPTGNSQDLRSALPALEPLFARVERELGSATSLSPVGYACLQGLVEGLDGQSLNERTAFYAEILQHEHVPIEIKRRAWQHLRKAYVISNFVDGQYQHSIKPAGQAAEEHFIRNVGRMLQYGEGKLPPDAYIVLLLKSPQTETDFFAAQERWAHLSKQGKVTARVDRSNVYDILFFFLYGRGISIDSIQSLHVFQDLAWHGKDYNAGFGGNVRPELYQSGEVDHLRRLELPPQEGRRIFTTPLTQAYEKLLSVAIVQGQELPAFLQALPEDVRALFSALLNELVPGVRAAVLTELKKMDATWSTGEKICYLLEKLGWAKAGQILSVSPLMPPDVRAQLSRLQDQLPPSTRAEIELELRTQLGAFHQQIESFEWPPVKSGSIGEVVRAKLIDGRVVAIKVVTQGRRKAIAEMGSQLLGAVRIMQQAGFSNVHGFALQRTAENIIVMLDHEMNLLEEHRSTRLYGELPDGVRRPQLIAEAPASSSVLVMEWIEGSKLGSSQISDAAVRERIIGQLVQLVSKPFIDGFFQGDPHPGNFMIDEKTGLVMLDFGQTQMIQEWHLDNVLRFALALIAGGSNQALAIAEALIAMDGNSGSPKPDEKLALVRKVEVLLVRMSDPTQISAGIFLEFLRAAHEVGVQIEPAYEYLFKYYGTLEGTIQTLHPDYRITFDLAQAMSKYAANRFPGVDLAESLQRGEVPSGGRDLFTVSRLKYDLLHDMDPMVANGLSHDMAVDLVNEIIKNRGFLDLRFAVRLLVEVDLVAASSEASRQNLEIFKSYFSDRILESYPEIEVDRLLSDPAHADVDEVLRRYLDKAEAAVVYALNSGGDLAKSCAALAQVFAAVLQHSPDKAEDVFKSLSHVIARTENMIGTEDRLAFRRALFLQAQDNALLAPHVPEIREQFEQFDRIRIQVDALIESTEGNPALRQDLSELRQVLWQLETTMTAEGTSRETFDIAFQQFAGQLEILLDTHGEALRKLVIRHRTRMPGLVPTMLVYFSAAEIERISQEHNIPRAMMPDVIGLASSPYFIKEMEALVTAKLNPETIQAWLETDEGQKFLHLHRDELRNRLRMGLPGLMVGILSLLGAEEVAHILGIDPRYQQIEHFAFVIAFSHMANVGTGQVQQMIMRRQMTAPFQLASARIVEVNGERLVEFAYHDVANVFSRGFTQALHEKFAQGAGKVVYEGGKAFVRFPLKMSMGMGLGIVSSHIANWILPGHSDLKNKLMFMSFFAPDIARIVFGPVQNRSAAFALRSVNAVFGAGFFVDLMNMGATKLAYGEESGYRNWVNLRASELKDEEFGNNSINWSEDWWLLPLVVKGLDVALELVAPQSAADGELLSWEFHKTHHVDDVEAEDRKSSAELQARLKQDVVASLVMGVDQDDLYEPEFYINVEFDSKDFIAQGEIEDKAYEFMKKRLEFEPQITPEKLADDLHYDLFMKAGINSISREQMRGMLIRLQRRHILDQLHFIAQSVNKKIRGFADRDGRIDLEADFYSFIVGGNTGDDWAKFEDSILFARKVALTTKLMFAGNKSDGIELAKIANKIGLMDEEGTWLDPDVYLAARQQWSQLVALEAKDRPERLVYWMGQVNETLQRSIDPTISEADRVFAYQELQAMGVLNEGSIFAALF